MSLTLYSASIPAFIQQLEALKGVLAKAAAHAEARKIDPAVLLNARLFPDMFPMLRQVQIAADFAKGAAARLAGREVPKWADDEKTFAELLARLDRTLAFIKEIPAAEIVGQEGRAISLMAGGNELKFTGEPYLTGFVLPNFYFHAATAYAILRHSGVELGKRDFLGSF